MNHSEHLKTRYLVAKRSYERYQFQIAKKVGWNTFYQIRPIDLTREDVEKLSREDVEKLQRLYNAQYECFWKMKEAEAKENNALEKYVAAKKADDFLQGFPRMDAAYWLREHGLTTFTLTEKLMENPNFLAEVVA